MRKLVIITKSKDDAYKFCFKIGINSEESFPVTSIDDMKFVDGEGFFTILDPLPDDAVLIFDSIKNKKFIKIEFDESGGSDAIEQIAGQLKFELRRFRDHHIDESTIKTVSGRIDEVIESCLPENKSPVVKFKVLIDKSRALTLASDSPAAECLVKLMRRYLI